MRINAKSVEIAKDTMIRDHVDYWLVYNFQNSNRIFNQVFETDLQTSRRAVLCISACGDPILVHHPVDSAMFLHINIEKIEYKTWSDFPEAIAQATKDGDTVAVDYVPGGQLPISSWVDAGFLDILESIGKTPVSSSELFQAAFSRCNSRQIANHKTAAQLVTSIKDQAFSLIGEKLRNGEIITEYDVQKFIISRFSEEGLEYDHPPVVAINGNAGDPHYEPTQSLHSKITKGDWILIDLWAKHIGSDGVFADITWVAYVGDELPEKHQSAFQIVKSARDAVLSHLKSHSDLSLIEGWQLDKIARDIIDDSHFSGQFIHRTGHNIGPGQNVHGLGMNLDDYETHDTRRVVEGTIFSVEPGIYNSAFGIRLECNVLIENGTPVVTTPLQDTPIKISV